jgi:hypothetical protein
LSSPKESSLQKRITATPTPLVDRLEAPEESIEEIDYTSSNPFGFQPQDFDNFADEKYTPSVTVQDFASDRADSTKKPINFYRDNRRRSQHRRR